MTTEYMRKKNRAQAKKLGRPSIYNEEYQAKAEEYLATGYIERGDVIPTIAGMALFMGLNRNTLYDWKADFPGIARVVDNLQAQQEVLLLANGLMSVYNSTITKLVLNKHGYAEKTQQDNISSDGSMSSPTEIKLIAVDGSND